MSSIRWQSRLVSQSRMAKVINSMRRIKKEKIKSTFLMSSPTNSSLAMSLKNHRKFKSIRLLSREIILS